MEVYKNDGVLLRVFQRTLVWRDVEVHFIDSFYSMHPRHHRGGCRPFSTAFGLNCPRTSFFRQKRPHPPTASASFQKS